jgi:hypothetical protein
MVVQFRGYRRLRGAGNHRLDGGDTRRIDLDNCNLTVQCAQFTGKFIFCRSAA